ncbi:hypothetical protein BD779DRAFT_1465287 [Infundibulicybe gibba]|nr:hypothetical protein BD779DRAFT_1465287 [Infundibulicybe gibba]
MHPQQLNTCNIGTGQPTVLNGDIRRAGERVKYIASNLECGLGPPPHLDNPRLWKYPSRDPPRHPRGPETQIESVMVRHFPIPKALGACNQASWPGNDIVSMKLSREKLHCRASVHQPQDFLSYGPCRDPSKLKDIFISPTSCHAWQNSWAIDLGDLTSIPIRFMTQLLSTQPAVFKVTQYSESMPKFITRTPASGDCSQISRSQFIIHLSASVLRASGGVTHLALSDQVTEFQKPFSAPGTIGAGRPEKR